VLTEVKGIKWTVLPGTNDPRPVVPAVEFMLKSIRRPGRLDAIRVV